MEVAVVAPVVVGFEVVVEFADVVGAKVRGVGRSTRLVGTVGKLPRKRRPGQTERLQDGVGPGLLRLLEYRREDGPEFCFGHDRCP